MGAARPGSPCPGRRESGDEAPVEEAPRISAAAVTDALTTAFMLLGAGGIEALCTASPGLEAWVLEAPADEQARDASLLHFGGPPAETSNP